MLGLSRTPHFNSSQDAYLQRLIEVIGRVVTDYETLPHDVSRQILIIVWRATKYLNGNTLNETPYEVVYSLSRALKDWTTAPSAITTALLEDLQYHFDPLDPAHVIRLVVDSVFDVELIQIALPKLYRHRPIYNVALYHELGHYLDKRFQIVSMSLLLRPQTDKSDPLYRREFFSDLIAASYTGRAIIRLLEHIAPDATDDKEHPATSRRIRNIEDFLAGKSNEYIDIYQSALAGLSLAPLTVRYATPDVARCFDNMRPYAIKSEKELHGILDAGWEYLARAHQKDHSPWKELEEHEIDRIINDLIEKSVRNWMITEKWRDGTSS